MPLTPRTYGRSNPAALLAYQTAAQLRFALGRAGFEPDYDFPTLHGDITASDEPFVTLGRCSVDVIRRLVAILQKSAGAAEATASVSTAGSVGTAESVSTPGAATQGASDDLEYPAVAAMTGKDETAPGGPETGPGKAEPVTGSGAPPTGG
jgi:hypothetical protein